MNRSASILLVALALSAGSFFGTDVAAQNLTSQLFAELKREVVQAIPPEFVQQIKKEYAEQIHRELIQEMQRNGSLGARSEQQASPAPQAAVASGEKQPATAAEPVKRIAARHSSPLNSTSLTVGSEMIVVVTQASNPVNSLSMDQLRQVFSGEYDNWSQLGGPDLPIKVVVGGEAIGFREPMLNTAMTPNAMRTPFMSFVIPRVDRTPGAVGFLRITKGEQVRFIDGLTSIKKLSLRRNDTAPAVPAHHLSLFGGDYPLVSSVAKH
jgi:ABC-type phosphate transport system substrate-binding protein